MVTEIDDQGEDAEQDGDRIDEMEDPTQLEYNALQNLTISTGIFKDGLITKNNFRHAQENDISLTELIRDKKLKAKVVDSLLCVVSRKKGSQLGDKGFRPIITNELLRRHNLASI